MYVGVRSLDKLKVATNSGRKGSGKAPLNPNQTQSDPIRSSHPIPFLNPASARRTRKSIFGQKSGNSFLFTKRDMQITLLQKYICLDLTNVHFLNIG